MSGTEDTGESAHEAHEAGGATSVTREESHNSIARSLFVFVKEIVIVVALAVVLSLIAKTWLVQTFWIPSASMMSTLIRDDRVLVSKLTPGPFDLQRGDIVVFDDPGGWLSEIDPPTPPHVGARSSLTASTRTGAPVRSDSSATHLSASLASCEPS